MPWREGLRRYLLPETAELLTGLCDKKASSLCEIRMYACGWIELVYPWGCEKTGVFLTLQRLQEQVAALTGFALYRFEHQMAQGYIPLESGCRAGICGRMTREEDGTLRMTQVTSICLRIGRKAACAARAVYAHLTNREGIPRSMLILGPPGCGKTTVLRDAAQYLSESLHFRVAAADEREELFPPDLSGCGRIDVLSGCDKANAMMMLLRSMSPQIIVCDEIGGEADAAAIEEASRCGAAALASAHADGLKTLSTRPSLRRLAAGRVFDRYVLLDKMGAVKAVWDGDGSVIWEEGVSGELGCGDDVDDRHLCGGVSDFGRREAARWMD